MGKNFDPAYLAIYQKIPSTYELFLTGAIWKMWSGLSYQINDLAIGAVASQSSFIFFILSQKLIYYSFLHFKQICRTYRINNIKSKVYDLKKKKLAKK